MLEQLGVNAKKAAGILTTADTEIKNKALHAIGKALVDNADVIISANILILKTEKRQVLMQVLLTGLCLTRIE